jgi:transcriptional repressor NrdR
MRCPYCGFEDSKVIDSRDAEDGVRRRRECISCGERFTTYERAQVTGLLVAKKDGRREEFTREKLLLGIRKACEKRPLAVGTLEAVVDSIETALNEQGLAEVSSQEIGEMVMDQLRELDHIAYIRFASVYREFADLEALKDEVEALEEARSGAGTGQQPSLIPEEELGSLARPAAWRPFRQGRTRQRQSTGRGGPSHRLSLRRKESPLRRPDGAAQENLT